MMLEGVVTNVAAFGAFVDIGVHQDGLVHISALSKTFVKDPRSVVKPGDIVQVKVHGGRRAAQAHRADHAPRRRSRPAAEGRAGTEPRPEPPARPAAISAPARRQAGGRRAASAKRCSRP